jgi:hypothetical protein
MIRPPTAPRALPSLAAAALLLAAAGLAGSACAQGRPEELPEPHPDLPPEFEQLLPRGSIASVDAPRFVAAAEADLPGDAWVLGVVLGGEARAYSLNLLNHPEVVNDRIGDTAFAAVW